MARHTQSAPLTLLIAVDGSAYTDAALRWVASLKLAGIAPHCVLLHVATPPLASASAANVAARVRAAQDEPEGAAILEQAAGIIRGAGLPCAIVEKINADPVAALLEGARAHACDTLVVGRRGRGALRTALLGSVSAGVVQNASCPVMVVNASVAPLPATHFGILLACDGSEPAARAAAFSLRLAAAATSATVHLLHVQPHALVAGCVFAPRRIDLLSLPRAERALAQPRALVARAQCEHAVHATLNDVPGAAIVEAGADLDCSLIAMGTRGLGAASGVLLGSVAQHVVELARVPVMLSR